MAISPAMKIPKIYKSGDFMYVCSPYHITCATYIRVYNITTGAVVAVLHIPGVVTGFQGNVKMTDTEWGFYSAAICDVFVSQDEASSLDHVQGCEIVAHQWWSTDQWSFNQSVPEGAPLSS